MSNIDKALTAATDTHALRIGDGILNEVPQLFAQQFPGKRAVMVAYERTYEIIGYKVEKILKDAGIDLEPTFIFHDDNFFAKYSYIDRLSESLKQHDAIPIAVGSGTINDVTKLSSHLAGRHYMCVATAASMDGYASYGASITANGAKQTFSCPAPQAILADVDVISKAPSQMTAAGYADLFAKVTAGADWILADRLGVEKIDDISWSLVQDGLKNALSDPAGAAAGDKKAITQLIEGLMLSGFAMQHSRTSRPASGAEHQFSHLWNMEHHTLNGRLISHGAQVSIGMLAVTAFYEAVLETPLDQLDIAACCAAWPEQEEIDRRAKEMFVGTDFPTIGVTETRAKYVSREELAAQLQRLKDNWSEISTSLKRQLVPFDEVKQRLQLVGAPTEPEEIGITRERLRQSFIRAQYIRRRFTVLDLAVRTGYFDKWLDHLFGKGKIWEISK